MESQALQTADVWIDKTRAAELLGMSKRNFERVSSSIPKRVVPPGPGRNYSEALYRQSDVEAFGRQRAGAAVHGAVARQEAPTAVPATQVQVQMLAVLAAIAERVQPPAAAVPLSLDRLPATAYLTIDEAAVWCRMPALWIRRAIDDGRLPAERVGRSWRVRRCDLEAMPARRSGGAE